MREEARALAAKYRKPEPVVAVEEEVRTRMELRRMEE